MTDLSLDRPMPQPVAPGARAKRALLAVGAAGAFALGLVGMVLPVMPTTVFWIVAAALAAKSCPAIERRIAATPRVGPVVRTFLATGALSRPTKRAALVAMTGSGIVASGGLALAGQEAAALAAGLLVGLGELYVGTRPVAD